MTSFVSLMKMKKIVHRIKKNNDVATLLGLDIGRIYVGTAITDKYISQPKLLKTLTLETGLKSKFYPPQDELNKNQNFFQDLQKIIKANRVKGLIIGYPIKDNKPTQHAYFVESLVKFMYKKNILSDLPCTFVNEAYSTFEAWRFLEMLQVDEKNYNPRFANNKKLKDQAAACVILQRFIEYYNLEENEINSESEDEYSKKRTENSSDRQSKKKQSDNIKENKEDQANKAYMDDKSKIINDPKTDMNILSKNNQEEHDNAFNP